MDRTKEFHSIVQLTEIPQYEFIPIDFHSNIYKTIKKIEESFLRISKVTNYESFRSSPMINSFSNLLNELKSIKIPEEGNRDTLEVIKNLKSYLNMNCLKYQLKLNEIIRKNTRNISNTRNRDNEGNVSNVSNESNTSFKGNLNFKGNVSNSGIIPGVGFGEEVLESNSLNKNGQVSDQSLILEQENIQSQFNEQTQERKRIMRSITEIGQIVEDISIHVKLQEEQLKRIDDIVIQSDKWLKKTKNELLDYWDLVRRGRGRIIKYFLFFFVVIFIFWLVRKV